MKLILGISAYFHDSSACLVADGEILSAVQEERFNREKNTAKFPAKSIEFCLSEAKITLHDLDAIVFFEKPLLKFERLVETYYNNAPKGVLSFLKAMPQWAEKKLFLRREIKNELKKIDSSYKKQRKLLFSSHHYSHAASAFYPSAYQESAILVIDAVGEWATATIGKGNGNKIELLQEMSFPNSVGLLYSSFTYFLGFKVNEGEYKLMGLSPYGVEKSEETQQFIQTIRDELVEIFADGSIKLNRKYFTFEYTLRMVSDNKWAKLFGVSKRNPTEEITQSHCNLAFAIQQITEEIILKMALTAKKLTQSNNLCLAGGVALNCVANGKLQQANIFDNIWIQPASGDCGGAIGAALAVYYQNHKREIEPKKADGMRKGFLGLEISNQRIESFIVDKKLITKQFENSHRRNEFVIKQVLEGKVIGWVQGKMEFGARALGARSIISSPSFPDIQRKLNLSIKFREDFRPFAPVMLRAEAVKYFGCKYQSDYMQFVAKILPEHRLGLPEGYSEFPLKKKLETPRSKFQGITHVDFSARLQVVEDEKHPFYELLHEMRRQSGDGILVNTSFNTNGEPIVCTLENAYNCFLKTEMDILVVGNYVFEKENLK